jgi:hypothetical protein
MKPGYAHHDQDLDLPRRSDAGGRAAAGADARRFLPSSRGVRLDYRRHSDAGPARIPPARAATSAAAEAAEAQAVAGSHGCVGCHSPENGPALSGNKVGAGLAHTSRPIR